MNGYVTTNRFPRIWDVPFNFGQTEVRRGKNLVIAAFELAVNQRIELRDMTVALITILTPNAVPIYLNTAMELCSAGLYRGTMLTGPIAYAAFTEQAVSVNAFYRCVIASPGTYQFIVSNNTSNVDLSVAVSGSFKFYY
jgi:hypothetical protein